SRAFPAEKRGGIGWRYCHTPGSARSEGAKTRPWLPPSRSLIMYDSKLLNFVWGGMSSCKRFGCKRFGCKRFSSVNRPVNSQPTKAGGFGLRLKAGSVDRAADCPLFRLRERVRVRGNRHHLCHYQ